MNRYTQKLIKKMATQLIVLISETVTPVLSMASGPVNRKIERLLIESKVEAACSTVDEQSKKNFWKRWNR